MSEVYKKEFKILDKHYEEKIDEDQIEHYHVIIKYTTFDKDPDTVKTLYIEDKYLPLYPYGNYVKTVITIENINGDSFKYKEIKTHDSWNGTGLDYNEEITFNINYGEYPDTETPWFFDFERLKENVESLKDYHQFKLFLKNIQEYLIWLMFPEE